MVANAEAFVDLVNGKDPDIRIVIVTPIAPWSRGGNSKGAEYATAMLALAGTRSYLTVIDGSYWIDPDTELSPDGLHTNPKGQQSLLYTMVNASQGIQVREQMDGYDPRAKLSPDGAFVKAGQQGTAISAKHQ